MIDTESPCYSCGAGWASCNNGIVIGCQDNCKKYREYKSEHPLKVRYRNIVGELVKLECVIGYTELCFDDDGYGKSKTHYVYKLEIREGDKRICFDNAELADIYFIGQT